MFGRKRKDDALAKLYQQQHERAPKMQMQHVVQGNAVTIPEWVPRPVLCWVAVDYLEPMQLRAVAYALPRIDDGAPVYVDVLGDKWLYAEPATKEATWLQQRD